MLQARLIDRLFAALATRYGAAWARMWEGLEAEDVKADWSRVLGGCDGETLRYALEHLPDKPPIATEFRAICRRAPTREAPRLPGPPANPQRVASLVARVAGGPAGRDPKAWARDLKAREEAGERLTQAQREMWREATRAHLGASHDA